MLIQLGGRNGCQSGRTGWEGPGRGPAGPATLEAWSPEARGRRAGVPGPRAAPAVTIARPPPRACTPAAPTGGPVAASVPPESAPGKPPGAGGDAGGCPVLGRLPGSAITGRDCPCRGHERPVRRGALATGAAGMGQRMALAGPMPGAGRRATPRGTLRGECLDEPRCSDLAQLFGRIGCVGGVPRQAERSRGTQAHPCGAHGLSPARRRRAGRRPGRRPRGARP